MNDFTKPYLDRAGGDKAEAAALLASDLMEYNARSHKAGYTFANALMAAGMAFDLGSPAHALVAELLHNHIAEQTARPATTGLETFYEVHEIVDHLQANGHRAAYGEHTGGGCFVAVLPLTGNARIWVTDDGDAFIVAVYSDESDEDLASEDAELCFSVRKVQHHEHLDELLRHVRSLVRFHAVGRAS